MPTSPIPDLLRSLANEMDVLLSLLSADTGKKLASRRKKQMPTSDEAKAVHAMMGRKPDTLWSPKEIDLFVACVKTGSMTLSNIELIGWYRSVELPKGEKGYCRRKLDTLLANWQGEIDAALNCPEYRRKAKAKQPANVISISAEPRPSEAELERIAAQATGAAERLKRELNGGAAQVS